MKCDRCENEATVHEVRIEAGKRREKHLCEHCARADGVALPQAATPITTLLSNFMLQQNEPAAVPPAAGQPQGPASGLVCSSCGTTYSQFRQSGLLGCPTCYAQFENQLVPLLARAHEGGTSHTGKSPRRAPTSSAAVAQRPSAAAAPSTPDPTSVARALAERVAMLKKRLEEAVTSEQYEKAAMLRDELANLSKLPQPGVIPAPASPIPAPTPEEPAPKRKPRAASERPPRNVRPPDGPGASEAGGPSA